MTCESLYHFVQESSAAAELVDGGKMEKWLINRYEPLSWPIVNKFACNYRMTVSHCLSPCIHIIISPLISTLGGSGLPRYSYHGGLACSANKIHLERSTQLYDDGSPAMAHE